MMIASFAGFGFTGALADRLGLMRVFADDLLGGRFSFAVGLDLTDRLGVFNCAAMGDEPGFTD